MNKNNENNIKGNTQNFNDKLAMFNSNATKAQNNQLSSKKISKPSINKTSTETKKEKGNIIQKEKEKESNNKEEKPKEVKNVLNIINQINNKNKVQENQTEKEIKKPIENSNFQASLNAFKNPKNDNKEKEIMKEKEKKIEKIVKNDEKIKIFKKSSKEKNNEKSDNKIGNKIKEINNKIDNKETNNKNNSKQTEENSFQNKLKAFNKDNLKQNDKNKENNNKFENKEQLNTNNNLMRKFTIQERINQMNINNKEPKEIDNKKEKNIKTKNDEKNKEIEKNQELKRINTIQHRATVFATKNSSNPENKNNQVIKEKVVVGEGILSKIKSLESQNSSNNNKLKDSYKRYKTNKNSFEPSIIDRLKSIYQPKSEDTQSNSNNNKPININNDNNETINNNQKEKEILNNEPIKNIEIINKDSETNENINKEDSNKKIPKKLDFAKIFGVNVEKITSMVNESKRQEIIKFAQQQKEENQRVENEVESDNSEEEKEKEEEIEKNQCEEEEEEFYQLERISNLDDNNKEEKEREIIEKKEKEKENKKGIIDKLKNKLSNFNFFRSNDKKSEQSENVATQEEETLKNDERNTYSNNDLDKELDVDMNELSKKIRKTLPFFNKTESSSSIRVDDTFLQAKTISQDDKSKDSTFCECFFLASFSKANCKIMENSYDNQAECNHSSCNILPALQPEIIYKYPKEDIKGLEINNLAASICFPNGIKLCYEEKEDNIRTVKNYRSSFTNQVGERFFAVTYHFFLRKDNREFELEHELSPIQYEILKYQDEIRSILNDDQEEDVYGKLSVLGELIKREYINIPYCFCLISKYPFIEQMEKCLESIMLSINDENVNIEDLNKYISYIVSSIPAPPNHCRILFPLKYNYKLVEIQPQYFRDINQFGDNPLVILNHIDIKNILILFKLLVFEQKVLIVGKDNDLVSQIILNFVTLLYPFEWVHTYIPVMSEKMLKFLQAFLPFFNGMNLTLLKKAKPILAQAGKGVYIFNIDDNTIDINSNYKENCKTINTISYINRHIPSFPKILEQLILKELKIIKSYYQKSNEQEKLNINLRIKNLFIQIFAELLYDYKNYSYVIDDYPVFNSFLLIKNKDKKDSKFFQEFTSTQLFQMFIQNSLFRTEDKKSYFEERLSDFEQVKKHGATIAFNLGKLYEKYKEDYSKFFELKKKYVIKPFFIKEFKNVEDEIISKNKKIKLSDIVKFLSKNYDKPNFTQVNDHGVLYENKRVIKRSIELTNDNDPNEIQIFYIPNQKEDENDNSKKNNTKNDSGIKKTKTLKMGFISKEEDNKKNNIKISQTFTNKEYELSEDEIDEIKDNIREAMTRVYRSDVSKIKDDKKIIIDSLKTQFGRDYFTKILNNGYKQDYLVKNLVNESYYFFYDVIFNTLLDILKLEENDENIICAVKLIKSSQYIGTIKNKKEFLVSHNSLSILSDELSNGLENYSLFNKIRFWELWIEDDMTQNDLNIKELINDELNDLDMECDEYIEYSSHLYSIIDKLTSTMMKMKINNNSIFLTIFELSKEYLVDETQIKELRDEVFGQLQIYKTYSNK